MLISIGEFVKFFRKRQKMSQEQLANILGCTTKGLSKIENGVTSPRIYTIKLFEDYFKVKISRYYQSHSDMMKLSSYEAVRLIGTSIGKGDYKRGYELARKFEDSKQEKNSECNEVICLAKASYYAAVLEDYGEAIKFCAKGLTYEDYLVFDEKSALLTIESIIPSSACFSLINLLGICYLYRKEAKKAVLIFEETLRVLNNLLNDESFLALCFSLEQINYQYNGFCNNLADVYYKECRYSDALNILEKSSFHSFKIGLSYLSNHQNLIKFKSLCALGRFEEALRILPEVLVHSWKYIDENRVQQLKSELSKEFPEIGYQIDTVFNLIKVVYAVK